MPEQQPIVRQQSPIAERASTEVVSKKSQSPNNRIPSSNYEGAENESLSSIPNRTNKDMSEKYFSQF